MASTDFGSKPEVQRAWAKELIRESNGMSFWKPLMAQHDGIIIKSENLKATDGATEAMHKMLPEMVGTGVTNANLLRTNEESLSAQYLKVKIGRIRNGVISAGKLSDQGSVIEFRKEVMTSLANWRANLFDSLMMKTMAGVSYALDLNGATQTVLAGQQAQTTLAFAADVSAPTANRHFNATATGIAAGATATITAASVITYDGLLDLVAEAKTQRVKALRLNGQDSYVLVLHPKQFAQLKKDAKFNSALINGGARGMDNPIFTGAQGITVDGLVVKVTDKVFNTSKAAGGAKWGAAGAVDGARALLLGQQAGFVTDLVGDTDWQEEDVDYKEFQGISVGLMLGMRKAVYTSSYNGTSEDFGCISFNTAI